MCSNGKSVTFQTQNQGVITHKHSPLCLKDKTNVCASCNLGYFLNKQTCVKHTICQPDEFESRKPSSTQDRICQKIKTCKSTEYESKAPTKTSDRVCDALKSCPKGKYLSGYTATKDLELVSLVQEILLELPKQVP